MEDFERTFSILFTLKIISLFIFYSSDILINLIKTTGTKIQIWVKSEEHTTLDNLHAHNLGLLRE